MRPDMLENLFETKPEDGEPEDGEPEDGEPEDGDCSFTPLY